ncbi:MAG TPA: pilus assembly protein TadG-related protein [Tepidisphaeraceae bacterium]|nr:pilus assembly protein TadG-related protein [Tepidisphaeraceae bacterium]
MARVNQINGLRNTATLRGRSRKAGVGIVWSIVVLVALCAVASLAVDLGRVQLVKNQLRTAADAAALAGGEYVLSDLSVARSVAIAAAKGNLADGKRVELSASDVTFVYWNEKTRRVEALPSGRKHNAIKVVAQRTTARGNPVELPFAKLLGADTCNATVEVIALAKPQKFAIVGLDFIKMSGNASNGYKKKGEFDYNGSIASNGDITLGGSSNIQGDAFPGIGRRVIGANHVSGSTTPLTKALVYPQADAGNAATVNDNANIPQTYMASGILKLGSQKSLPLAGGVYYLKGLDLSAGSELKFTGPATVYVAGSIKLAGHAVTYNDVPENLKLVHLGTSGTIEIGSSSALYADIYAPAAPLTMNGTGDVYGAIVAKSISMTGNSAVHYDLALKGGVSLVK